MIEGAWRRKFERIFEKNFEFHEMKKERSGVSLTTVRAAIFTAEFLHFPLQLLLSASAHDGVRVGDGSGEARLRQLLVQRLTRRFIFLR